VPRAVPTFTPEEEAQFEVEGTPGLEAARVDGEVVAPRCRCAGSPRMLVIVEERGYRCPQCDTAWPSPSLALEAAPGTEIKTMSRAEEADWVERQLEAADEGVPSIDASYARNSKSYRVYKLLDDEYRDGLPIGAMHQIANDLDCSDALVYSVVTQMGLARK
jgi:hypothetical protein